MTALRRCAAAATGAVMASVLLGPAPVGAFYGNGAGGQGALVVSASLQRLEQADDRSLVSTISRDGRYVVFETRATNLFADGDPDPLLRAPDGSQVRTDRLGGIFRRDLQTGALEKVADGDIVDEVDATVLVTGARSPSVSADGRYVAFSTALSLVPGDPDEPRHHDVYVRDMSMPECRPLPQCTPNPYTLVSALDGGATPLTYAQPSFAVAGGLPGSAVWPATSISADGRRVVFRTEELASDAPGAPLTAPGTPSTPGFQLLLRDLDAQRTQLLTRTAAGGEPAGGSLGPATISGNGEAIAWAGANARVQTPFLEGELTAARVNFYLYRRADPDAPTRRITGFVDVEDPACPPGSTIVRDTFSQGPCYGPLTDQEEVGGNISASAVAMSDDGLQLAFLTSQSLRGAPSGLSGLDLYTTSMAPGALRKSATAELTREAIGDDAASRPIDGVAMSADGRYLAIATRRVRFTLGTPRPLGVFRTRVVTRDLYVIDRESGTIERAARALDGGDPNDDIDPTLAISADGGRVTYVSPASNLFFGDANERADAFVSFRQPEPPTLEPPPEPPLPADTVEDDPDVADPPRLSVRALAVTRTGRLTLEVRAPAAGRVDARARARLPGNDGRRKASSPILTLSRAKARARQAGRIRVELRLSARRIALLRRVRRLDVSARVEFVRTTGGPPLSRTLRVAFRVVKAKRKTAPSKSPKKKPPQ